MENPHLSAQTKQNVSGPGPLPENFNLNLADSEQSLNFDISESRAPDQTFKSKQKVGLNQSSSKNLHDGSDTMDQNDFDLSESNFSMSKKSGQFGHSIRGQNLSFSSNQQRQRAGTSHQAP